MNYLHFCIENSNGSKEEYLSYGTDAGLRYAGGPGASNNYGKRVEAV